MEFFFLNLASLEPHAGVYISISKQKLEECDCQWNKTL